MTSLRRSRPSSDRPSAEQIDAVLRASRALVGIAAVSIAETDDAITMPQFRVLVMLHTRGPMNLAAVAAGLDVNPSNASRTCERLSKAGLLDRKELPKDRRNVTLTLTDAGRRLVDNVTRHRRVAIERVLRKMSAAERDRLAKALSAFAAAAGEPSDDNVLSIGWHLPK
ncbi:MarR family transcriptional regulator [Mycobacterium sp. 852002-51163_SCH5372311]|uniref:MarR family winged helix-turn-helix transcriptional regulator n=1 Tax=Mycobacterium sp. 852002-51163_SCH5372311 TaxID=1834097 RepID=UPI0007FED465|nr:MarR family transcriptional regulator [Mycobacterium sp. 852002-51163_SCH5372311]OBF92613.1 MarR family transcriptional regulator [Mycobacterium sp. 852002-51163_SCH5372311]